MRLPYWLYRVQSPSPYIIIVPIGNRVCHSKHREGAHRRRQFVSTAGEDVQQAGLRRDEQAVAGRQDCRVSCLQHGAAANGMRSALVEGGREAATSALSSCRNLCLMRLHSEFCCANRRRHSSVVWTVRT